MQNMSFWFTSAAVECGFLQCGSRHVMAFLAHPMHRIPTNVLSRGMFTDERAGGISRIIFKHSRLRSNIISQQTQVTLAQHLQIIKKDKKYAETGRHQKIGPAHLKSQRHFANELTTRGD